jgi:hypothetical protein
MGKETTRDTGGQTAIKELPKQAKKNDGIPQEYINLVEKRLSLPGGTLLVEIGAAIADRYGQGKKIILMHSRMLAHNVAMMERYQIELSERRALGPPKQITIDEAKALINKGQYESSFVVIGKEELDSLKANGTETFQKERADFANLAEQYVIEEYGEKLKNEFGKVTDYGERVEVLQNAHLHKRW